MPLYKITNATSQQRYVPKPVNKVMKPWDSVTLLVSEEAIDTEEMSKLVLSKLVSVAKIDSTDVAPVLNSVEAYITQVKDLTVIGGTGTYVALHPLSDGVWEFELLFSVTMSGQGSLRMYFATPNCDRFLFVPRYRDLGSDPEVPWTEAYLEPSFYIDSGTTTEYHLTGTVQTTTAGVPSIRVTIECDGQEEEEDTIFNTLYLKTQRVSATPISFVKTA